MSYITWMTAAVGALNRQHLLGTAFFCLSIIALLLSPKGLKYVVSKEFPVINRRFAWEPKLVARFRWALFAREILEVGYKKVSSISVLKYQ